VADHEEETEGFVVEADEEEEGKKRALRGGIRSYSPRR